MSLWYSHFVQMLEHNVGSDAGLRDVFDYIQEEAVHMLERKDSYLVIKSDLNIYNRLIRVCIKSHKDKLF